MSRANPSTNRSADRCLGPCPRAGSGRERRARLFGTLLLLAGLTAAALRSPPAKGIGRRLLAATPLLAAALGAFLWWDWWRNGANAVAWTLLLMVAVAFLIVLLGSWVAQAQHPSTRRARRRSERTRDQDGDRAFT